MDQSDIKAFGALLFKRFTPVEKHNKDDVSKKIWTLAQQPTEALGHHYRRAEDLLHAAGGEGKPDTVALSSSEIAFLAHCHRTLRQRNLRSRANNIPQRPSSYDRCVAHPVGEPYLMLTRQLDQSGPSWWSIVKHQEVTVCPENLQRDSIKIRGHEQEQRKRLGQDESWQLLEQSSVSMLSLPQRGQGTPSVL